MLFLCISGIIAFRQCDIIACINIDITICRNICRLKIRIIAGIKIRIIARIEIRCCISLFPLIARIFIALNTNTNRATTVALFKLNAKALCVLPLSLRYDYCDQVKRSHYGLPRH